MAVTKYLQWHIAFLLLLLPLLGSTAILPEDRTDVLYHRYEGGGITIDGPSVLLRKEIKNTVSVWGNYYVDSISGASIDLLSRGSTFYQEERKEQSVGVDYLHDKTIMSLSYTNSSEKDYEANTFGIAVSQEFFDNMTTFSINYSQGDDEVRENIYENNRIVDTVKRGDVLRKRFGVGLTQVLTKKWLIAFNLESVIDEGFLNNPYRVVRFRDGPSALGTEAELYPGTRNSDAFAVRSMYYLPYRAAIKAEYRTYSDSWGIDASNYELRYTHPLEQQWIFEVKYRGYSQNQADFYSDLFSESKITTFRARDKEMSAFSNSAIGIGISYEFKQNWLSFLDKTSLHFYWDRMTFDYDNFRENTPENTEAFGPGQEPLYSFNANVFRLFLSMNY